METTPPPVFIVGAPRSGTTLLAAMFGAHPLYAAGPETQFFIKIAPHDLLRAPQDPAWPAEALRRIQQLHTAGQSTLDLFETDIARVEAFLKSREPSVAAMLEALVVPFSQARGKPGWVEKTPNHLEKLELIRAAFPDARIVRIVRDPRDAAPSTARLPAFSDSIIANAYLWREWFDQSERVLAHDELSATLRYEDLVAAPAQQLEALCQAIQVPYSNAMLDYQSAARDVSSKAETWKKQVSSALDASRSFAWKKTMDEDTAGLIGMICHEWLERFGYETGPEVRETRMAYNMSAGFVEEFEPVLRHDARQGLRWLGTFDLAEADRVFDHPRYYRFANPIKLARLAAGRAYARRRLGALPKQEAIG